MAKPLPEHMQCSPCLKIRKSQSRVVISHANEIFWILLLKVKYFGYFSYNWNILDIAYRKCK